MAAAVAWRQYGGSARPRRPAGSLVDRVRSLTPAAAVLRERRRLARELHDGLGHELALLSLTAGDEAIAETAQRALEEARAAIFGLEAPADEPVAAAVERLGADLARRWDRSLVVDPAGDAGWSVAPEDQASLSRVVREAVVNAFRHGEASRVHVEVDGDERLVRVRDDGRGFRVGATTEGLGLGTMRERCAAMGAVLAVRSIHGGGTSVEVLFA
jgi:signal transduction histidine kinase